MRLHPTPVIRNLLISAISVLLLPSAHSASAGGVSVLGQPIASDWTPTMQERAEKGDRIAQDQLALAYTQGLGTNKDEKEAVKWWMKAADQGDHSAQWRLGECFELGKGVKQNYSEAAKWYLKAADELAVAQAHLATLYEKGLGVKQNDEDAFYFTFLAARAEWTHLTDKRDELYKRLTPEQIVAVQKRLRDSVTSEALESFEEDLKKAKQGDLQAQWHLTLNYEYGNTGDQNYAEAYYWSSLAALHKAEDGPYTSPASLTAPAMAAKLTVEQKADVDKRIAEWKPESAQSLLLDRMIITTDNIVYWKKTDVGIFFELTDAGAKELLAVTMKNVGKKIETYVGSTMISGPTRVNEPIAGPGISMHVGMGERQKVYALLPAEKEKKD